MPHKLQSSFIKSFVKEIKVMGNEGRIKNTFPIPRDNHGEEGLGVLPIVRYSGLWGTVPELLFEKKGLIPELQKLLVGYQKAFQ
jgi:hypothetical protein